MLVAAAVCPHPPLLVPGVSPEPASEIDVLRQHCLDAVATIAGARPDLVVVVGGAEQVGAFPADAWGSLQPYGPDVSVGEGPGGPTLPLSLTVGLWLLRAAAPDLPRAFFGVPPDADPQRCASLGAGLVERAQRVALLVMGDGSARRTLQGPGYLDSRAEPFDSAAGLALDAADAPALLGLDPVLGDELLAAGRAPWQVLAGAAQATGLTWRGAMTYAEAPYGVAYLVATWRPAEPPIESPAGPLTGSPTGDAAG